MAFDFYDVININFFFDYIIPLFIVLVFIYPENIL